MMHNVFRSPLLMVASPILRTGEGKTNGRYGFLGVEEAVAGFGCRTENCDTAPVGFAFDCFGFFFSRLLLC